ncbi:hypothetical protein AU193_00205 [Mycobacterium sp. GA-1285]|nr:hypothetical protein AU193_00205 [Mycobacterium sp. GA-1285]
MWINDGGQHVLRDQTDSAEQLPQHEQYHRRRQPKHGSLALLPKAFDDPVRPRWAHWVLRGLRERSW